MLLKRQLDLVPGQEGIPVVNPLEGLDLGDPSIKFGAPDTRGKDVPPVDTKPPEGEPKPPEGDQKPPESDTKPPVIDTKPPEAPVISDEQKLAFFNETVKGSYTNIDDFVSEFTDLKTRATGFDNREKELQELAKTVKNPLADYPDLAKAQSFFKATDNKYGLDTFMKIKDLDLEKANHLELMVDDFILKNPDVDRAEVKDMFEHKYKLNLDSFNLDETHEDYELHKSNAEKEILRNKLQMRSDATPILENFKEMQKKIVVPDYEADELKAQEEAEVIKLENKSKWEAILPKLVGGFKEFNAIKPGEKEPYITMKVSEEQSAEISKMVVNHLEANGYGELNQDNMEKIGYFMYNLYSDMYRYDIANSLAVKKVAENDALWAERTGEDPKKYKPEYKPPEIISVKDKAKKKDDDNNQQIIDYMNKTGV